MSRVAAPIGMIARKATQVVAVATMPRSLTQRAPDWSATLAGQGFACGLRRCKAYSWNDHAWRLAPCIPSRKAAVAAMWDLFRVSLITLLLFRSFIPGYRNLAVQVAQLSFLIALMIRRVLFQCECTVRAQPPIAPFNSSFLPHDFIVLLPISLPISLGITQLP